MKKILLVEDYEVVSTGIRAILNEHFENVVIVDQPSVDGIFKTLRSEKFDLLIIDVRLSPDPGYDFFSKVRLKHPELGILAYSDESDALAAVRIIRAGANGLIIKNFSREDFCHAVELTSVKRIYLPKDLIFAVVSRLTNQTAVNIPARLQLTQTQIRIGELLISGMPVKDIGTKLGLSSSSISNHKAKIFKKLRVRNLLEFEKVFRERS